MTTAMPSVTSRMLRSSPCDGRPDHEALQRIAEREENRREQKHGEIGIEPEQLEGEEGREERRTQQRAMREIDDVQDAIDQRQPQRHQRIDGAGQTGR